MITYIYKMYTHLQIYTMAHDIVQKMIEITFLFLSRWNIQMQNVLVFNAFNSKCVYIFTGKLLNAFWCILRRHFSFHTDHFTAFQNSLNSFLEVLSGHSQRSFSSLKNLCIITSIWFSQSVSRRVHIRRVAILLTPLLVPWLLVRGRFRPPMSR